MFKHRYIVSKQCSKCNITDENAGSIATKQLRTEGANDTVIILVVTYTFSNGTTAANQIFIQQEG